MCRLYDATTIDTLPWPKNPNGEYAKKYLTPLVKEGISRYISNVTASLQILMIDDVVLPLVVATANYSDAWVCSMSTFYVSYPMEQLHLLGNPLLKFLAKNVIGGIGKLGRVGSLNSVVYVNNWLFSTDIYPEALSGDKVERLVSFLKKRFVDHAIVFRSLTPMTNARLVDELHKEGCRLLASRSVFFTDPTEEDLYSTRIIKSDLKLWREKKYEVVDEENLKPEEYARVLELYRQLYIDSHSSLNPQVTLDFIQHLLENRLFTIRALKENNSIEGVVGFFVKDGVMMCPLLGYNKQSPQSNEMYRLLSTALLLEAKERKCLFHQSAGGSFFKKIRRGVMCTESMAIYTKHLPLQQKFPWLTLRAFINNLAIPYMQKY